MSMLIADISEHAFREFWMEAREARVILVHKKHKVGDYEEADNLDFDGIQSLALYEIDAICVCEWEDDDFLLNKRDRDPRGFGEFLSIVKETGFRIGDFLVFENISPTRRG